MAKLSSQRELAHAQHSNTPFLSIKDHILNIWGLFKKHGLILLTIQLSSFKNIKTTLGSQGCTEAGCRPQLPDLCVGNTVQARLNGSDLLRSVVIYYTASHLGIGVGAQHLSRRAAGSSAFHCRHSVCSVTKHGVKNTGCPTRILIRIVLEATGHIFSLFLSFAYSNLEY